MSDARERLVGDTGCIHTQDSNWCEPCVLSINADVAGLRRTLAEVEAQRDAALHYCWEADPESMGVRCRGCNATGENLRHIEHADKCEVALLSECPIPYNGRSYHKYNHVGCWSEQPK